MSSEAKMLFKPASQLTEFVSVEEVRQPEFTNGAFPFGASRFTVPAGKKTPAHSHADREVWLIKAGRGAMVCAGREFHIESGDIVHIEPNSIHSLTNIGDRSLEIFSLWLF